MQVRDEQDKLNSASARLGHFETVPSTADGLQIARVFGVVLDLFANTADVDIDRTGRDKAGVAPDGIEQMVAAEDAAGMAGEIVEQAELSGSGGSDLSPNLELHRAGVDDDVIKSNDRGAGWPLEAAQYSLDAGEQLACGEWFGDVVVRTHFETQDAVVFPRARSKEDYGYSAERGIGAETPANIKAIAAGNHDVEKKKHGWMALCILNDVDWGLKGTNGEARCFQMMLDQT